jgi:carboxymethylenebutenolidase
MKEINKEDLSQEVFDLYDAYAHNRISRRQFMDKLSVYAVGGITVASLLSFVLPKYEETLQIPVDADKKLAGIVEVHENRGLNPHIEDVGRRAALAGFISIAPDALTPLGGYPGNDDDGRTLQRQRDRNEMLEDFIAAFEYLKKHPSCDGNVGVVGFCFGGWISNMMAVKVPDLGAAVPFYGGQPAAEMVPEIEAPLLLHFAGLDQRVNEGWPAYEAALKEHNKEYVAHMYPDVNHGFHNDSTPRYDQPAAELAWKRTIEFFNKKLK